MYLKPGTSIQPHLCTQESSSSFWLHQWETTTAWETPPPACASVAALQRRQKSCGKSSDYVDFNPVRWQSVISKQFWKFTALLFWKFTVLTRPDRSQSHRCIWFTLSLNSYTVKHLPLPMCPWGVREMLVLHSAAFQTWERELFRKVGSQRGRTGFNLKMRWRSNLKF